jgi:putative Mn2+ efflux pump MntP
MANTAVKENQTQQVTFRTWLISFAVISALMVGAGFLLAGAESGAAQPWTGVALLVALGLAMVVGASKTSSA